MKRVAALGAVLAILSNGVGVAGAATLYVTNTKSDSISIIDTNTFEVTGTIALGQGKPNRVVFHPNGKTAWVVYDKSHDLGVVDAEAQKLLKRVKIGGNPYNLAFSPDGTYLYVLDWASETSGDDVIVYDLAAERVVTKVEVSTWPAHAIFSKDARLLYVSGETAGDLTAIDTKSFTPVARIVHGGGDAMGLALSPDGRTLYCATGENRSIVKVDTATHTVTGTIPVPGIVHEATLTPDGKFLYTTLRKANKIVVIATADDRIVATIPQRAYPDLVVMEPSGRHAFVTNRYADAVAVIDIATHRQLRTIAVGKAPHGIALRPR
ncbi:MAG: PD40 domain-containing protein [Candidatus Rokubacteria bacterium]|nr:PD40 domain-containing protein [Candidatus Rokubacteria bacterium]